MTHRAAATRSFWRCMAGVLAGAAFAAANFGLGMGMVAWMALAAFLGVLAWIGLELLLMHTGRLRVACPDCGGPLKLVSLHDAQDAMLRSAPWRSFVWPMRCERCHVLLETGIGGRVRKTAGGRQS